MKKLTYLAMLALIVMACQPPPPKQYFTESPEIDIAKAAIDAYTDQDWDAYRQLFADTAAIYRNSWGEPITIDSSIAIHQGGAELVSDISWSGPGEEGPVYEMIVTDEGAKWVHFWGLWNATFKATGQEFAIPVNISLQIVEGKIAIDAVIFDSAPITMAVMAYQESMEDDVEDESDDNDDD